MNQKRFPEEFKTEAVRQIVERGHPVAKVSPGLGSAPTEVDPITRTPYCS
jgi:transposase-like protein